MRVKCECLSASSSAFYPLQHPHLPPAIVFEYLFYKLLFVVINRQSAIISVFFNDLSEVLDHAAGYSDLVYIVGDVNVRLDRADDANSRQLTDLLEAHGFSV